MKKIVICLVVLLLAGCSSELMRVKGQPFDGYSCRESIVHFYTCCSKEEHSKEFYDTKIKMCEDQFAAGQCDKEQAALLWCMGRTAPGTYYTGGPGYRAAWVDGCDCSGFKSDLKKCKMENNLEGKFVFY